MIEPDDAEEVHCGDLVTTSEFVTSIVADQKLFFSHEVMREDCMLRPEWEAYMPKWEGRIFETRDRFPQSEVLSKRREELLMNEAGSRDWSCPFEFLFKSVPS